MQDTGYVIEFSAIGRSHDMLMGGWSYAEERFTWTLGNESTVFFPAVMPEADYELAITVHTAGASAKTRHRATFRINNIVVGGLIIEGLTNATLFVPASTLLVGSAMLTISLPDALSLALLGTGSTDQRLLSLAFHKLTFRPFGSAVSAAPSLSDRDIMLNLQNLGVNCELGLAQRSVGAEPFGLFRFAKVPLPKLMAALATQFEGYGSPGSMEIVSDVASEFQIIDKVFGFRNHSFAFANQGATADAVMQREIRRIPYLVRNLINELQEASKLFVFHDAGLSSRQEIDELVNVIGSYNPGNTLLWVQLADPDHPAGSAYLAKPGLICGFLSHFEPVDIVRHVRIPDWLEVARKAHAIWAATRPQTT